MPQGSMYTSEERKTFRTLEKSLVDGIYKPMEKKKLSEKKKSLKEIAKNTIAHRTRKKTISIRITEYDLLKIKALSLEEGIPYQNLIHSAIHKLTTRKIF